MYAQDKNILTYQEKQVTTLISQFCTYNSKTTSTTQAEIYHIELCDIVTTATLGK